MGKNKKLRKAIAGQLRTISEHQTKIEGEIEKPIPDITLIQKWEKDIDIARRRMRKLEERLGK